MSRAAAAAALERPPYGRPRPAHALAHDRRQEERRREEGRPADKTLWCVAGRHDFVWTGGEQEQFRERGLMNEPRRCREHRQKRHGRGRGRADGRRDGAASGASVEVMGRAAEPPALHLDSLAREELVHLLFVLEDGDRNRCHSGNRERFWERDRALREKLRAAARASK